MPSLPWLPELTAATGAVSVMPKPSMMLAPEALAIGLAGLLAHRFRARHDQTQALKIGVARCARVARQKRVSART